MGTLSRYLGYGAVVAALLTVASFLRSGEPSTPLFALTFVLVAGGFLTRSVANKRDAHADGGPISDGERPSKTENRPDNRPENSKDSDSSDGGGFSGGGFDGGGGK